jgi:tetratricopeptide (TPR) repeat protein
LGTLAVCVSSQARAGEISRERLALLNEALQKFEQAAALPRSSSDQALALYRQSAEAYESLIADGVRNGKIYYNLGNAYYRLGDIGRAVLAYRRAREYEPRDAQLQANLRSARSQRANRIEEPARNRLVENLLFWHVNTSLAGRIRFAIAVFSSAWVLLIVNLFWPRRFLVGVSVACLLLSVVAGVSSAVQIHNRRTHPAGVILAEDVIARTGNGQSYQPQFEEKLQPGVEFTLLERRGDWLRIRLPDDQQAWIRAETAETL